YRFNEEDGKWHGGDDLVFDWDPFIGTIGCAHGLNHYMSIVPFEGGGNMDVPDVKPGNTLYLPVSLPGAHLALGDCHGRQGQGEICGTALEMAAKVTLKVDLIKNKPIQWPRIESDTEIMCVGAAKPMEDAARIALCELIDWLVDLGWEKNDAYQAVSQNNKLYVGNMVNPNYTMVAKIDKEIAYRKQK
ncbi:MAG: acetamidase/formamidase family protein, partial [Lachnospiraceae bacterium]|nr:acetamidase/formamidase family protein [Lachnospiraceae bacterium]